MVTTYQAFSLLFSIQEILDQETTDQEIDSIGWSGFLDLDFLVHFVLSMLLAAALGALIAYHPRRNRKLESVEQLEVPRLYVIYAVVGALIGTMVVQYGLVIGFVIFGLGGLLRFRTDAGSAANTGRVILVTLIGLSSGLNLPHVAVLSSIFGYVLIFLLDRKVAYRIEVNDIESGQESDVAEAYREVLEKAGYRIITERKNVSKHRVTIILYTPHHVEHEMLEDLIDNKVPEDLRGVLNLEMRQ